MQEEFRSEQRSLAKEAVAADLAGQRNYEAFLEASRELLPPVVQTWNEMHPRVRQAWIKAAEAVLNHAPKS